MARTKTSITGLFAHLLKPVTDALEAETGRTITTAGWGRIARNLIAKGLRVLASAVEPQPEPTTNPEPAPVAQPEPTPAAQPDLPEVPTALPEVPFGWGSLDLPALMTEQAADRAEFNDEFPTPQPAVKVEPKPARKAKTASKPKGKASKAPSTLTKPIEPLTVAEVATKLKTQPRAVRKWIEAKRLTASKTASGWTVAPNDLEAFLATLTEPKRKGVAKG